MGGRFGRMACNNTYPALKHVEGVLILRNSSLKLKTVVDNVILLNYAVSSENISDESKGMNRDDLEQKVNVGIFRRNKKRPEKQSHRRHLFKSGFFQFFSSSESFIGNWDRRLQFHKQGFAFLVKMWKKETSLEWGAAAGRLCPKIRLRLNAKSAYKKLHSQSVFI